MRQKMSPQRRSQQTESIQLDNVGRQRSGPVSAQMFGLGSQPSHVFRNGRAEFVDDENEPIEWGRAPRKPHASVVKQPVDTMSASANSQTVGSFPIEETETPSGLGFGGMGAPSFPPMPFPHMPFPFPPPSADGAHPFMMPPYPFPIPGSADFASSLQHQHQQQQSHGANQPPPQMMMMMVPMMPPGSTDLPPPAFFPMPMPSGPGAGLQWPPISMLPQLPPATPVSGSGFDSMINQSRQQSWEQFQPQSQQPHRNAPAASGATTFPKPLISPLRVGNTSSHQLPRQQPQAGSLLPMLPSVAVPESMIHSHESSHTPKALGGQPNFAIGQSSMVRRLVPTLAPSPQNKQQYPQQPNPQSQPQQLQQQQQDSQLRLRNQPNSQYQFGDRPSIGLGPNVWQSKDPINSAQSTARSLADSSRALSSSLSSPHSSTSSATPTVHPTLRISRSADDPSPSNVIWASQDFDIDGAGAVNPSPSPQSLAVHSARPPPVISSHRDQAGGHTRIQAAMPPSSQIQSASTVPKSNGPQTAQPQSKLPLQSQATGVSTVVASLPRQPQQPQQQHLSAKPASSRLRSAVQSPGRGADSDVEREVDNLIDWSNELDLDDSL
jgi:hypothetical protein